MAPPRLRVDGRNIIRTDNNAVVNLWGAHLYWHSHGPSSTTRHNDELAATEHHFRSPEEGSPAGWGSNFISYWLHTNNAGRVNSNGTLTQSPSSNVTNHLDALVNLCNQYNAYLMPVWAFDSPTGGQTSVQGEIFPTRGIEVMRWAARYFNGNPAVFLAIQSEPNENLDGPTMRDRAELAIDQMREEWPDVMIAVPGDRWSQRLSRYFSAGYPNRPNIVMKPHIYSGRLEIGTSILNSSSFSDAMQAWNDGFPIIVGEAGIGGRSNRQDLEELIPACRERDWGFQGWAMRDLSSAASGSPRFVNQGPITNESLLTEWGVVMRDESRAWWFAYDPEPPAPPDPPPSIDIPTGSLEVIRGGNYHWEDGSWGSGTSFTIQDDWIAVTVGSPGGFQPQMPNDGTTPLADHEEFLLLIRASTSTLNTLRLIVYESHGPGEGTAALSNLGNFIDTSFSDDWKEVRIPFSAVDFGGFDSSVISRLELENPGGGGSVTFQIADWVLTPAEEEEPPPPPPPPPPTVETLEITVQPQDTEAGEPIGGPPTVRVRDQDGNPLQGVTVTAALNQGVFAGGSVTSRTTNSNGDAAFTFLVVNVPADGYRIIFSTEAQN